MMNQIKGTSINWLLPVAIDPKRKIAISLFPDISTNRGILKRSFQHLLTLALAFMLGLSVPTASPAQTESGLRSDHPQRYVVKKGDTLWDIARQFLRDPWRWPLIWQKNPQIENPHLIFPGDLLVVTDDQRIKAVRLESPTRTQATGSSESRTTVRLKPQTYSQPLERAIPTIPPHIIEPFLTSAMIVEPGDLEGAGYVLSGVEDEIILGKYNNFYARGLTDTTARDYRVFRLGRTLSHPDTDELLGIEGIHLGDARMLRAGDDVSRLTVIDSNQEIIPRDRLLPVQEYPPLPYYQPHIPERPVSGWVLHAPRGVREVGRFDVVIISGGTREGLQEGHVLRALYHRGKRKDPLTGESYQVPDEESGLMMVFRVFDKLSYALIMESTRAIGVGDRYESPEQ